MSVLLTFYLTRADESARAAKQALSADLRTQHLTSELAWRSMANGMMLANSAYAMDAEQ